MLATAIAITVAVIVGFWVVGGLLLRLGGLIVAFLGILTLAITGNLAGLIVLAVGLVLWLVGHWHYALRHHDYKSPLAQRLFQLLLPSRLDPTQGWVSPVAEMPVRSQRRLRRR